MTRASITNIIWKKRFDRSFDSVPGASIGDVVAKYKSRRALAKQWTAFDLGVFGGHITPECRQVQKKNQGEVLKMLRYLILGEPLCYSKHEMTLLTILSRVECP